ncbi:hypothetical protein CRUP_021960 [Coryphaenoides rupestris]|nr:hypothetical protein CRUP_021960 [Coryphaenoides rupestris]
MAASMSTADSVNILQFMKLVGQLKRVPRTGWVYRGVTQPESVSDHMYRMAILAMTVTDPTVNKDRCMKLALVHDMAECIVGDIAPMDNEYESQSSPEARLVKQFDLLEMILQAHEYEELEETPGRLQEFFDSTEGRFHHPDVVQLVDCLKEERRGHMTSSAARATPSGISPDPVTDSAEAAPPPPPPQPPTHTS